jgi:hypothetical protein
MEYDSSRYVPSRLSLWCPICGAIEGKGCTVVEGLRFSGHNAYALGQVRPVQIPVEWESAPVRKNPPLQKRWAPKGWIQ